MKKVDFTEFLLRNCLGMIYVHTYVHLFQEFVLKLSKIGQSLQFSTLKKHHSIHIPLVIHTPFSIVTALECQTVAEVIQ